MVSIQTSAPGVRLGNFFLKAKTTENLSNSELLS
jgi:hypothetical protein